MATLALQFGDFFVPVSAQDRVARLSDGQRICLALVDQHLSSKEIALRLGISPHTVDQRVRQALQILGVEKRGEAARMVASELRASMDPAYQRLIHQHVVFSINVNGLHSALYQPLKIVGRTADK